MKNNDVERIRRILAGDENAFVSLVKKYQKQVHALAWRKIGDFHIAEEITQDTFLKVYQKLSTLKDPNQFSGWLYVIATNQCRAWLRKKRIETASLEDTDIALVEGGAYSRYVADEHAKTTVEAQREVVKKLLAKLKESERTVMTLHYFGDMTCEEISRFLGVSTSAIKLRLHRARQRLQKEEPMIREALSNFQLSPNLTENIMQEIPRIKPAAPSGSKPLVPWVLGASTALLIVLMLGMGSQYLARFQQPYSLDGQSEMMVELIDAPIVLNLEAKPDVRNQLGENSDDPGKGNGTEQELNQVLPNKSDYTHRNLPKGAKARFGKGTVHEIAYSPDGKRLAIASGTGIWLYDTHTGEELDLLTGHTGSVITVAFSPDGSIIASGSGDDTVRLWNAHTGQTKQTLTGHRSTVTGVAFSSDGRTLASSSMDSTVRLWDVVTGNLKKVTVEMPSSITGIVFAPGGDTIAGWGGMKKLYLLDVATGKSKAILETEIHVSTVTFSPDGEKIVIGGDTTILLLDVETGRYIGSLNGHSSNVTHLTFSPDGNILASASLDNTLKLWNFDEVLHGNSNRFNPKTTLRKADIEWLHVVFSPDGGTIASSGLDGSVLLWDVATGQQKTVIKDHTNPVRTIAFSPGSNLLASEKGDQVLLWDINTQQKKGTLKAGGLSVRSIAFSPDGKTLVTGNERNTVLVWDMATKQQKTKIKILRIETSATKNISDVTFSPDGNLIATSGGVNDDSVYLWNAATGKLNATLKGQKHNERYSSIKSIAFSPDGRTIASGVSRDEGIVQLWDIATRQLKATLKGHEWSVFSVVFSPDGKILANSGGSNNRIASNYGRVHLWDPATAKQEAVLNGHTGSVLSIAFSSDGKTIATGSIDKTVRLWDITTRKQKALFEGHMSSVNCVAFSSDGKTLVSGSADGTILLWDLTSSRIR